MIFSDLIAEYKHFFTATALINLLLLLLTVAPIVICLKNSKPKHPFSPRIILIAACAFTTALVMVFGSLGLPQENPLLWYFIWAVLLFAHWNSWVRAVARGKDPTSTILPLVLPLLLLCAVGLGQKNWLLAAAMAFCAVTALIKKGMEVSQWN